MPQFEIPASAVTMLLAPVNWQTELTGPLSTRLYVSSTTTDADLFVTLRAFDPQGEEVTFGGANDPAVPISQGWLRLSHRELDAARSTPGRPVHQHRSPRPVRPGEVYPVDVEVWPTSVVLPKGYTLALTVGGADFARGEGGPMSGSGPFLHTDPQDRPAEVFGGRTTIHTGAATPSSLLLPVVDRS
ncbi:MAG: CocE/NonD family hydrolase C-terminal non-catalytic domain-containing protein [Dermatophilaceae bacterium]